MSTSRGALPRSRFPCCQRFHYRRPDRIRFRWDRALHLAQLLDGIQEVLIHPVVKAVVYFTEWQRFSGYPTHDAERFLWLLELTLGEMQFHQRLLEAEMAEWHRLHRKSEICNLQWVWKVEVLELHASVFIIPRSA